MGAGCVNGSKAGCNYKQKEQQLVPIQTNLSFQHLLYQMNSDEYQRGHLDMRKIFGVEFISCNEISGVEMVTKFEKEFVSVTNLKVGASLRHLK